MALIDFEGFDRETDIALSNWWQGYAGSSFGADGSGYLGYGRYCQPNDFTRTFRTMPATGGPIWINAHVFQPLPPGPGDIIHWQLSGTSQCAVRLQTDMRVSFMRDFVTLATTPLPVMALNAWYFLQLRSTISNSVGTMELWINGQLVLSFTGNNSNTGAASCDQWAIRATNGTRFDNILVYNETGAAPNARTPETRIYTELPNANGSAVGWTPSAGANYQCVDEQPNDGDTSYNSAGSAPLSDLYAYPSTVPTGAIVYAVAAEYDVRKDDGGTNEVDPLVRSGGTTYARGEVRALTTSYQRFKSFWETDPATGSAWTPANANAAEIGIRRTA